MHVGSVAQLCLTLCDMWVVTHQTPLSMGFSRQEYWSGLPFPTLGYLPSPGIKPTSLVLQLWQMDSLPLCHQGDARKRLSSVELLSHVWLFVTPWTAAHQASLSIANFQSLLKLMSIEPVMPSNHLILCRPLLLLPSTFSSIRRRLTNLKKLEYIYGF